MAPEEPDKAEYLIFPKCGPLFYDRKKKKKLNTGDYSILFQNGKWKKDLHTIFIFNMIITLGDGDCH